MPIARTIAVLALTALMAIPVHAGLPAGGLDLFADYWLDDLEHADRSSIRPDMGPLGGGPFRMSFYGVAIGNVQNNAGDANAPGFAASFERLLHGPFLAGLSVGSASSDTLRWTHGEAHVGMLMNEKIAVRAGYNSDTYEYPANTVADENVSRDLLQGFELGADIFGSPAPGWFLQLSADLLPLKSELTDGTSRGATEFTARATALIGFSLWRNFDITLIATGMPRLGDVRTLTGQIGGGASFTF